MIIEVLLSDEPEETFRVQLGDPRHRIILPRYWGPSPDYAVKVSAAASRL
ncbi:MAG: hypothetical protein LJE95_07355 [Acidobacteria bacterium]|nr:hypothetical protein [Acidobacteriota bacterium]